MFRYEFSFDTIMDSSDYKKPEVEILDYQYGSSHKFGTYANKEMVASGKTFKQSGIRALMPKGEFLYVKWRVIRTGQVFEDKVDLSSRLPDDMEGLELHFVVKESQLYVFLIYPWDGKPWEQEPLKNEFIPVPGGVKRYQGHKQVQIYPDPLKQ